MVKKVSAVVDRISEGKHAVIIAEEINKEFIIDVGTVNTALREGLWVDLFLDNAGSITEVKPNEETTERKKAKVSNVMDRLRKRKGSKYKL